jgi:hypothetical protein
VSSLCRGLRDAWSELKFGHGRDQYMVRNVIEAAMIEVGDGRCLKAASKRIGMNKRTLRRAVSRRAMLNDGVHGTR